MPTERFAMLRDPLPTLPDAEAVPSAAPAPSTRDRFLLSVLAGEQLGKVIRVDQTELVIGRGDDVDAQITDPGLSWQHARLRVQEGGVYIEDLGSTNGTFVGGTRVRERIRLRDGDRIGLGGRTLLKFSHADALEEGAAVSLYESAVRDSLTGIYNRRYAESRLTTELSYAERHDEPICVLFIDIDHFKRVNDRFGHHVGDAVLRVVAATIQRIVRPEDVLARFGGEEFVVLARSVSVRNAGILAERVRQSIERLTIPVPNEAEPLSMTVSVGVAVSRGEEPRRTAASLIESADAAMYEAKQLGRNRVACPLS